MKKEGYRKTLQWVLFLIAVHSICFGLVLIIMPIEIIEFFGFRLYEKFFAIQGGVFHLIISVAYLMAAKKPEQSVNLIILSCFAKFSAAVFLFLYFFIESQIIMVLLSAIGDLLMGLAICYSYILFMKFQYLSEKSGIP